MVAHACLPVAQWIPQQRFNNLSCGVVSCDAGGPPQAPLPPFGASLVATLFKAGTLGFKPFSCDCASGGCRAALVTAVDRGELWSAIYGAPPLPFVRRCSSSSHSTWIIIHTHIGFSDAYFCISVPPVNENFTADVLSHAPSLGLGNATTQAQVEHIFAQGRSYTTLSFMRTVVNLTVAPISAGFGQQLIDASAAGAGPAFSPSFFLSPFTLRETNLAPVRVFGEHFASYLLCLLLWMGSAFTVRAEGQGIDPNRSQLLPLLTSARPLYPPGVAVLPVQNLGGGGGRGGPARVNRARPAVRDRALVRRRRVRLRAGRHARVRHLCARHRPGGRRRCAHRPVGV